MRLVAEMAGERTLHASRGSASDELRDRLDRAAIARGLGDELKFHAWYDAEIEPLHEPLSRRQIARRAFHLGLAVGREERA